MPEEARDEAPDEVQDQPAQQGTDAPDPGTSAPTGTDEDQGFDAPFNINEVPEDARPHVEQYMKQLQGAYTNKTQELANERRLLDALQSDDPRLQTMALEALGYDLGGEDHGDDEFVGEEDDFEAEDGFDPNEERLSAVEQRLAQEEYENWLVSQVDDAEQKLGRELSDEEQEALVALAEQYEDEYGPNFEKGFQTFKQLLNSAQKNLIDSKRTGRLPATGQAGSQKVDFKNDEERVKHFAALLDAGQDDE